MLDYVCFFLKELKNLHGRMLLWLSSLREPDQVAAQDDNVRGDRDENYYRNISKVGEWPHIEEDG